jgi:hypothetical protein
MAKLFDTIFTNTGSSDVVLLVVTPDDTEGDPVKLWCHSMILSQYPYFCKMLQPQLREGRTGEVLLTEERDEFVELLRFMYTSQVDINRGNVVGLLTLADKYCIEDVVDLCLKHVKDHFDADMFFNFFELTTFSSAYRDKLNDQIMSALQQRRHFCSVIEDPRWCSLPLESVEVILAHDNLPVASEAEVLTLIRLWIKPRLHCNDASCAGDADRANGEVAAADVERLLSACRKSDHMHVRMEDLEVLAQAFGMDCVFSDLVPRTGSALWDPSFAVKRFEATLASNALAYQSSSENVAAQLDFVEHRGGGNAAICHQLGPKDILQQEPGWMHPGVHKCRVSIACTSWSHRERRLLRSNPGQAAALQKRAFDCNPALEKLHDRTPSPPPSFAVRRPSRDLQQKYNTITEASTAMTSTAMTGTGSADGSEQVDHQIIVGVASGPSSGYHRHAVRISQRDQNAIYLVEDLQGKQSLNIGGTINSVTFDAELLIEEASKYNLRRCRFALLRNAHVLHEEWFDTSAMVPVWFFITSASFDKVNSYAVSVQWQRPAEQCHFYIEERD